MLLCIVYAMLFVDTVDMNIKACNALNALFVDTVDTGVCGFYTTLYRVMRCENCIDSVDMKSIDCIGGPCLVLTVSTNIVLMVWLQTLSLSFPKLFCGLKIS